MAKKVEKEEKAKKAIIETAKVVKATSKKTKEVVENLAKKVIKPKIAEPEQVEAVKTTPADKPKKTPKAAKPEVKEKPDTNQPPAAEQKKAKKEKIVVKEPEPVPALPPVLKHTSRRGRKPKSAGSGNTRSTPPKSFMNQPSKYMTEQAAAPPKPEEIAPPKGLMPGRATRYSAEDLEFFKKIIIEKKDEIIEQIQVLKDQISDPSTGQYINENSPYSLHMAEQGTDAMEREKAHLYVQRETKFLSYLEDALKRVENGTYGLCLECIDEPQNLCPTCPLVPRERLAAVPHTQLCVPIKIRQEKKKKK